jgi:hypothetical protein
MKSTTFVLFILLLCVLIVMPSHANTFITGSISLGGSTFSPSNNVTMSAASDGTNYSAKAKHLNGDRRFGTGNNYPKIHYIASPVGATVTSTSSATFDFSNWSAL